MPIGPLEADLTQTRLPTPTQLGITPHPMTSGAEAEAQDVERLVQASIIDTSDCLAWDRVYSCPAVKRKLEVALTLMSLDHKAARKERCTTSGVLLFGRPGTGKTVLVYALARKFNYTFYDISMADINSKWEGESEKYVTVFLRNSASFVAKMV